MALCMLCGRGMGFVRDHDEWLYSCKNQKCADYGEFYVRQGYPSDAKIKAIHSHKVLPHKIKKGK